MTAVCGRRGVGKTYQLAKELYKRSQRGAFCISNFYHVYSNLDCSRMSPDEFYETLVEVLLFKDSGYEMYDLHPKFKTSEVFVAIDEGGLYFSADLYRRYQSNPKFQAVLKLLAQARKQDVEIWYSVQTPDKIDKNFRRFTEEYILYRPMIPLRSKVNIRDSRGIIHREIRIWFPILWEEVHNLPAENPVFNYKVTMDENGNVSSGESCTLVSRTLKLSGWMDPFPYTLYDSNQVLATQKIQQPIEKLLDMSIVPHTFKKKHFKRIRKMLGFTDTPYPTRYCFDHSAFRVTMTKTGDRKIKDQKVVKLAKLQE